MRDNAPIQFTVQGKVCPVCDGRGGARSFYDYARGVQQKEFCERCDGYGYINVPVPVEDTSDGAAA